MGWGSGTAWFPYLISVSTFVIKLWAVTTYVSYSPMKLFSNAQLKITRLLSGRSETLILQQQHHMLHRSRLLSCLSMLILVKTISPLMETREIGTCSGSLLMSRAYVLFLSNNLTAWHTGDQLVLAVAAQNNNTIVVVHSVGPLILEPWIEHPNVTAVCIVYADTCGLRYSPTILGLMGWSWRSRNRKCS